MCKASTPIKRFWLMQMLGNFESKRNLYFIFSAPFPVQESSSCH